MKQFEIYFTTQKKDNEKHPIGGLSVVNAPNKKEAKKILKERMKKILSGRTIIIQQIVQ